MVVTPGEFSAVKARKDGTSLADEDYPDDDRPDQLREGPSVRCPGPDRVPRVDPGRDVSHRRPHHGRTPNGPQLRKEFTVKPGETLDLGDILIEKPGRMTDDS